MKIAILDPGLVRPGGHHHDWDTRMANEMAARGHEVRLYAHAKATAEALHGFSPEVGVEALFRFDPYLTPDRFDPYCGDIERQIAGRDMTAQDLRKVAPADLWLWPTLFSYQLWATAGARPKAAVSACLLLFPGPAETFAHAEPGPWWRYAAKAARTMKLDIRTLGIPEAEGLNAYLPFLGDLDPVTVPIPVDGEPRKRAALETVGFFGARPREEHGSLLVPALIERCLARGLKVVTQEVDLLMPKVKEHPGLTVLGHEGGFPEKLAHADLVVMPYQWHKYLGRGSGIAYQAMASGAPCVVPRGASFSRTLAGLGAASVFSELTVGSVFDAILDARRNYSALAEAAHRGALDWRKVHGVAKFVDAMIDAPRAAT